MKTKKVKNQWLFLSLIAGIIICTVILGRCNFKPVGGIGFLMAFGVLSSLLAILFIFLLVTTWDRDWMRIVSLVLFLLIFITCTKSELDFSLLEIVIISVALMILPFSITFIFYNKERKENFIKRGYCLVGYLKNGEIVFYNGFNMVRTDENCKITGFLFII
jgi:hypothetical protein